MTIQSFSISLAMALASLAAADNVMTFGLLPAASDGLSVALRIDGQDPGGLFATITVSSTDQARHVLYQRNCREGAYQWGFEARGPDGTAIFYGNPEPVAKHGSPSIETIAPDQPLRLSCVVMSDQDHIGPEDSLHFAPARMGTMLGERPATWQIRALLLATDPEPGPEQGPPLQTWAGQLASPWETISLLGKPGLPPQLELTELLAVPNLSPIQWTAGGHRQLPAGRPLRPRGFGNLQAAADGPPSPAPSKRLMRRCAGSTPRSCSMSPEPSR
jgi:hypothetical protein